MVTIALLSAGSAGVAGLRYGATLRAAAKWRKQENQISGAGPILLVVSLAVGVLGCTRLRQTQTPWIFVLAAACFAVILLLRVRRTMMPVDHEWWFDAAGDTPGEWVTLLVHSNDRAEALSVDGPFAYFTSKDEAAEWLEENGYLPAERAVEQELVRAAPAELVAAKH